MIKTLVKRLWLVPVVLVAWELITKSVASPYFPQPTVIVARMYEMWFSGPLILTDEAVNNFVPSIIRLIGSWSLAVAVGVALGVAIGRAAWLADYIDPLVEFGRAVPPPVMFSVFLVLFSMGTQLQVATIVFGIIWPILLNSIDGARNVDRLQIETASVFGVPARLRLFRIILPAASPKIFAGLRLSVSLALILMIVSELKGSTDGIGYLLSDASAHSDMPALWGGVVVLGVLGYVLNALFLMVERPMLTWHRGARRTA
ncbi:ABC transporter permease [Nonomuraea guangzhouensis]|uniref:ABC transporter permease n=1 Tax=Nonomuraea guangzhouensis TaxID=1291555 RepID=A0ABW4GBN7_9ACTN|nr:ABC transporter permease subunit [Nonomuraea guangzhouensis]